MLAWIKEQWGKELVRCGLIFCTIMATNVALFWSLYFRLRAKSAQWPNDRGATLIADIREMCLSSYPQSQGLCNRLGEQYDLVVVRAYFHADLFSHYIAEHFAALSLTFASSILSAACVALIVRKGWEHSHNYVNTAFIAFSLSVAFFGGYPQLAQHEENVKDNEFLFLEHGNLANEMRTFAVTRKGRTAEDGSAGPGELDEFIHHIDATLAKLNRIPLEFDASAVDLGSTKFMELQTTVDNQ